MCNFCEERVCAGFFCIIGFAKSDKNRNSDADVLERNEKNGGTGYNYDDAED